MTTRYTNDHEYIRIENDLGIVGITDYAQEQLGDIVFVELPEVGKVLKKGDEAAVIESVKAASEVYTPVSGEIVEINEALTDAPDRVNEEAETGGWLYKIKPSDLSELEALMDEAAYKAILD